MSEGRPGFFETGRTYRRYEPYLSPELTEEFTCAWAGPHPDSGALVAMGFGHSGCKEPWVLSALTVSHWNAEPPWQVVEADGPGRLIIPVIL